MVFKQKHPPFIKQEMLLVNPEINSGKSAAEMKLSFF